MFYNFLSSIISSIASLGAGMISLFFNYEPPVPKDLQK